MLDDGRWYAFKLQFKTTIQTKLIRGNNLSGTNTSTFIPHGISDPDKILSVTAMVDIGDGRFIPPFYQNGEGYVASIDDGDILISHNSAGFLGLPVKIYLVYEE